MTDSVLQVQLQLSGIHFAISCDVGSDSVRFVTLLDELFASSPGAASQPNVRVVVRSAQAADRAMTIPSSARLLTRTPSRCVWTDTGVFWLQASGISCAVSKSEILIAVDDRFWLNTLFEQRDFLLVSVVANLRLNDIYALHGNALVRNGTGIIVTGNSGAGKTTLTHALISDGWQYLSDDAVALQKQSGAVHTWALRKGFSLTDQAIERSGSNPVWDRESLAILGNGKRLSRPSAATERLFIPRCTPSAIFFTSVGEEAKTTINQVSPVEALLLLLDQASGLFADESSAAVQLNLLRDLVEQCACFRLVSGRDVISSGEDIARVSELILNAAQSNRVSNTQNGARA